MIRRLGCLIILGLIAYALWLTKATWKPYLPIVTWPHPNAVQPARPARAPVAADTSWVPITARGVDHTDQAIARLSPPGGPAYVALSPGDFAAFMLMDAAGQVPPPADAPGAQARNGELVVRATVNLSSLDTSHDTPGALRTLLNHGGRQLVEFSGTFDVVRRGVAEFRVDDVHIHGVAVPSPLIPALIHRVEHGAHPAGIADNGLLLNVPPYVADIRLANGEVLVYKVIRP